jgi:shikimate kinase
MSLSTPPDPHSSSLLPDTGTVLPIALVGLPGGGKSTVGKHLARTLGRAFLDSDAAIEQRLGCSIKNYFARQGEVAFRAIESEVIDTLTLQSDSVLATGGGAVERASNRHMLRNRCQVIYLRSSPEQLYRRLRHDTQRPLLQVADPLAKLRSLHAQRDPLYLEVAHFVIETGAPSVSALVRIILERLRAVN